MEQEEPAAENMVVNIPPLAKDSTKTPTKKHMAPPSHTDSAMTSKGYMINECLCFIQNKANTCTLSTIVSLCGNFYNKEEISAAKYLLFEVVKPNSVRYIKRRGDKQKTDDIGDMYKVLLTADANQLPTFTARNLSNLPPLNVDNYDVLKLADDVHCLKTSIQQILESQKSMTEAWKLFDSKPGVAINPTNPVENDTRDPTPVTIEEQNKSTATSHRNEADCDESENDTDDSTPVTIEEQNIPTTTSQADSDEGEGVEVNDYETDDTENNNTENDDDNAENDTVNEANDSGSHQTSIVDDMVDSGTYVNTRFFKNSYAKVLKNNQPKVVKNNQPKQPGKNTLHAMSRESKSPDSHVIGANRSCILRASKQRNNDTGRKESPGVFVTRLSAKTSSKDIEDYISNETGIKVKAHQLRVKYDTYSSWHLQVDSKFVPRLLEKSLWPYRSLVKRFVNRVQ
jgi:hypothetical protein